MRNLRADAALLCRDKINAREEFSPPKLGLLTENEVNLKWGYQTQQKANTAFAVIMISGIKAENSLLFFAGFGKTWHSANWG